MVVVVFLGTLVLEQKRKSLEGKYITRYAVAPPLTDGHTQSYPYVFSRLARGALLLNDCRALQSIVVSLQSLLCRY